MKNKYKVGLYHILLFNKVDPKLNKIAPAVSVSIAEKTAVKFCEDHPDYHYVIMRVIQNSLQYSNKY